MSYDYGRIAGWRNPIDKEHDQILEAWRGEVRPGMRADAGQMKCRYSIALMVCGCVVVIGLHRLWLFGMLCVAIGVLLFFVSVWEKRQQLRKRQFLIRLVQRRYMIVSGETIHIDIHGSGRHRTGWVAVRVPGYLELRGPYRIPFRQVRYYASYEIHNVPILFIRMSDYDTPFAVVYGDYI